MSISIFNYGKGRTVPSYPEYTYTGTHSLIDDGNRNWRIKFLTSGVLTLLADPGSIDLFLVGGGGGGTGNGGGGGYTLTVSSIVQSVNVGYPVVVGNGGANQPYGTIGSPGGLSSALGYSANGGIGGGSGSNSRGGNGGSGGGSWDGGNGGSDGSNGGAGSRNSGGIGQGTTTREFEDAAGDLYSSGGGADPGVRGVGLTGNNNGAGGQGVANNTSGNSGIVIIRNAQAA